MTLKVATIEIMDFEMRDTLPTKINNKHPVHTYVLNEFLPVHSLCAANHFLTNSYRSW